MLEVANREVGSEEFAVEGAVPHFRLSEFPTEESQRSRRTHDGLLNNRANSNGACICGERERNARAREGESCG